MSFENLVQYETNLACVIMIYPSRARLDIQSKYSYIAHTFRQLKIIKGLVALF